MKIKHFRGIFSRDNLPKKIRGIETEIINLDDSKGSGTHWVCYRKVDRHLCEYFDPFGLIMPYDIKNYLKTSGRKLHIQQMKYKKGIVYYAVISVYIIFWRDKKVDQY